MGALLAPARPRLAVSRNCGGLKTVASRDKQGARKRRSSVRKDRHRLDRGGDRQLNRALHVIAITRARIDPQTRAYLERKRSEGKSNREALRCLKRHLARQVHRLLSTPPVHPDRRTRIQQNTAISVPCLT